MAMTLFLTKKKADRLRFWHCVRNPTHRAIDGGRRTILFGFITIWRNKMYIGCECGKQWYSTSTGEWIIKRMNEKK